MFLSVNFPPHKEKKQLSLSFSLTLSLRPTSLPIASSEGWERLSIGRGVSASAPSCTTEVVAAAEEGRDEDGNGDGDGEGGFVAAIAALIQSRSLFFLVLFSSVTAALQTRALAGELAR